MKILIAADMEGISGVTNWNQVDPNHAEYARFRRLMTGDVNAAVRGICGAGVDEILVVDGHERGTNILLEELDPSAHLICGDYTPLAMIQGVDQGIDGVIFVGYHARAGSKNAILDHTWSSRRIANLYLNDILVGEYGLNGAVARQSSACRLAMRLNRSRSPPPSASPSTLTAPRWQTRQPTCLDRSVWMVVA